MLIHEMFKRILKFALAISETYVIIFTEETKVCSKEDIHFPELWRYELWLM